VLKAELGLRLPLLSLIVFVSAAELADRQPNSARYPPGRAEYGDQIVSTLSRQLTTEYGTGFSRQNLFHMMRFVEAWPNHTQVTSLAQHLGWSHFKEILYLDDELARQFYAEMCRLERWSVRTLRDRVRSIDVRTDCYLAVVRRDDSPGSSATS